MAPALHWSVVTPASDAAERLDGSLRELVAYVGGRGGPYGVRRTFRSRQGRVP